MRRLLAPALILGLIALWAVPPADADSTTSTTTTSPTTTTTQKPVRVAPLTGLPGPQRLTKYRSALTVKIDNTPEAFTQFGLQDADDVYEEIVEGGITRLAAIFNTRTPTVVGPVRSVRRTDREIVFPIGGIFAFSGGAQYAVRSIETAPVKLYNQSNSGAAMFRDSSRPPPHNLLANAKLLMAKNGTPRPPRALFTYLKARQYVHGPRVKSFVVGFASGYAVTYTWDSATKSWDRTIFGAPDVSANGVRISPKNVIVMFVHYVGGVGVIDSYAQLIGSGPVDVFSGGKVQRGRWDRGNLRHRAVYVNSAGKVINLVPGQTFVELLDVSEGVSITPLA